MYSITVFYTKPVECITDVSACYKTILAQWETFPETEQDVCSVITGLQFLAGFFIAQVGTDGIILLFIFVIFSFIVL